jgi:hypothetical protein
VKERLENLERLCFNSPLIQRKAVKEGWRTWRGSALIVL